MRKSSREAMKVSGEMLQRGKVCEEEKSAKRVRLRRGKACKEGKSRKRGIWEKIYFSIRACSFSL